MTQDDNGRHKPEFIYVEEEHHEDPQASREQVFAQINKISTIEAPWSFRILSFLMLLLCLMWALGALLIAFPFAFFTLLTLGQVERIRDPLIRFWKMFQKALTTSAGFFIAIFSPVLGFSFLLIAFLIRGETDTFNRIYSRWTNKS